MNRFMGILAEKLRPSVWRVAEFYDIRINSHVRPQGQHPVVIEGGDFAIRHQIPKSVYFNTRSGSIVIGKNCVFGEDVMVLTGKHYNILESEQSGKPLHYVPEDGRGVVMGEGCYIGSGAIIIGSVSIGDYAVVGAGSVVTKDVPPRTFVAGIPAMRIKSL